MKVRAGSMGAVDRKKHKLWIILLGMLIAAMAIRPELWAAPEQSPRRQTVPRGTLTPTSKPKPPRSTATSPSPSPTVPIMPTFTLTPGVYTVTPSPSPTIEATASPTTVTTGTLAAPPATPTERATVSSATVTLETPTPAGDPNASATASAVLEESPSPTPVNATPQQTGLLSGVGSVSPLLCVGGGMVVVGLVLLAAWRLRA